jgi:hypothetical protein
MLIECRRTCTSHVSIRMYMCVCFFHALGLQLMYECHDYI